MASRFVILTNKAGQFHTEPCDAVLPVETYDYFFYETRKARFVIAELLHPSKVVIVDEGSSRTRNLVPTKFLPSFDTLEIARSELKQLVEFGNLDVRLVPVLPADPIAHD